MAQVDNPVFGISEPESRERALQSLPPVFLRLFGNIDYDKQLRDIPEAFRSKVVLLTTCETPDKKVCELASQGWSIKKSETVTDEEARNNSSLLLNEGLQFARDNNLPYAFFLSSGLQQHLETFYDLYSKAIKKYPQQDAYYFILPETHKDRRANETDTESIDDFLLRAFPCETALILKTSMPSFETEMSVKGAMGTTEDGIPLGGVEFFLTLLDTYKKYKDQCVPFSPSMRGIIVTKQLRTKELLTDPDDPTLQLRLSRRRVLTPALVVTPNQNKLARRIPTFRAAMTRLDLKDEDIRVLFSNTQIEDSNLS